MQNEPRLIWQLPYKHQLFHVLELQLTHSCVCPRVCVFTATTPHKCVLWIHLSVTIHMHTVHCTRVMCIPITRLNWNSHHKACAYCWLRYLYYQMAPHGRKCARAWQPTGRTVARTPLRNAKWPLTLHPFLWSMTGIHSYWEWSPIYMYRLQWFVFKRAYLSRGVPYPCNISLDTNDSLWPPIPATSP